MTEKTFIIAEAGANHNRDKKLAFELIKIAKECDCTAVKFQTYSSETLYSKNTPDFAGYKDINKLIKEIELPRSWQKDLKSYCDDLEIEFMSTPFDEKAIEELYNLGVKRIKIAGFEATDLRLLDLAASTKLPLIVSAGIGCNVDFIKTIIEVCHKRDCYDLTILHCNNAYPTPQEDINLNTITEIKKRYPNIKVGLSDHTMNCLTPSLAVALGAEVIEKHFTKNRNLPGPDHPFALEPDQLKKMVENIKLTEQSLNVKKNKFTQSEIKFKKAGRSIVAKEKIKAGDELTEKNITTKRPFLQNSIPASKWFQILGKKAKKDYDQDDFI